MIDLETYANKINIPIDELKSKSRKREIVTARSVYWYYLWKRRFTYEEIARIFNMNYSTVIYGVKKINDFIELKDSYIERYLNVIEYKLK